MSIVQKQIAFCPSNTNAVLHCDIAACFGLFRPSSDYQHNITQQGIPQDVKVKVKVKQSRYRPRGFQEVKVPRFRDNDTGWW